jgi:toxin HigB-1
MEELRKDRAGQYSIRVSGKWRICFVWRNGDAEQVEFCDYH